VYNINDGCNSEIMHGSEILSGYMYFVNSVRKNIETEKMDLENAIETAINSCISNGIMSDFLKLVEMR
jgi:hypothetical protein